MAGAFELAPADGGPRVVLSPGETVIGRGPLLGITDKRISRRHAILEVLGDQLRIKPTHINPCFHQSSEKSQFLPLEVNKWHWLHPGDSFSLLVDKYIFHVFSTHSEMECTLRNSQVLDEDDLFSESLTSPVQSFPGTIEFASSAVEPPFQHIDSHQCSEMEKSTEVAMSVTIPQNNWVFSAKYGNNNEQLNSVQRKRILPAWMVQGDLNVQNLEVPLDQEDNRVTKGRSHMCPASSKEKKRSSSSENIETEQDPRKKCRLLDQEDSSSLSKEVNGSSVDVSKTEMINPKVRSERSEILGDQVDENLHDKDCEHRISPKRKLSKIDENEEEVPLEYSREPTSHSENLFQNKAQELDPELSSDPEAWSSTKSIIVPQDSEENHPRRTPCVYGASCYRKNPVHFQQFSHPGDSDYEDAQVLNQHDNDNRPECPYGASCYRKNPQHKIEYKHSTPSEMKTERSKRRVTKRGASVLDDVSDNDGQPNEYDLNDNFLDDEEEEYEPTDEDSDWEPANEDQEGEDVDELLKEAKKFMKRNR